VNLPRSCAVSMLVLLTSPFGVHARDRVTLNVSPVQTFAPANLFIRIGIDPSVENRGIDVEAESESFYRSSFVPLDGDRAPRTTTLEMRSLPSGVYEIRAVLLDDTGRQQAVARREVVVIPSAADR